MLDIPPQDKLGGLWKRYGCKDIELLLRNAVSAVIFRLFMTLRALWSPSVFGVAGAVFDEAERVLLVRQRYMAGWRLPGGGVDRGEPPQAALLRELGEEVGLTGGAAHFFGLYNRRAGWASNVVALYRVTGGSVNFRPNLEISEICFADPAHPPEGCSEATLRRLSELSGTKAPSPTW
jgi:8-oxo-dGTP pyrophosphatase MutT (NUDIX family)